MESSGLQRQRLAGAAGPGPRGPGGGGKAYFQDDLDFFRVYTKVHDDFAAVGDHPPKVFAKIPGIHPQHKVLHEARAVGEGVRGSGAKKEGGEEVTQ